MATIKEIELKRDFHHDIVAKMLVGLIEKRSSFNRKEIRLMRDLLYEMKVSDEASQKGGK